MSPIFPIFGPQSAKSDFLACAAAHRETVARDNLQAAREEVVRGSATSHRDVAWVLPDRGQRSLNLLRRTRALPGSPAYRAQEAVAVRSRDWTARVGRTQSFGPGPVRDDPAGGLGASDERPTGPGTEPFTEPAPEPISPAFPESTGPTGMLF